MINILKILLTTIVILSSYACQQIPVKIANSQAMIQASSLPVLSPNHPTIKTIPPFDNNDPLTTQNFCGIEKNVCGSARFFTVHWA